MKNYQNASQNMDNTPNDQQPVHLYSTSTVVDHTTDPDRRDIDYPDEEDSRPTSENLDKQYKLFCTRKGQIEEPTLPR